MPRVVSCIVYGRVGTELRGRVRERVHQLGGGGAVREKRGGRGIRGRQRSRRFSAVTGADVIDREGLTTYCYCMKIFVVFVVRYKLPRRFRCMVEYTRRCKILLPVHTIALGCPKRLAGATGGH